MTTALQGPMFEVYRSRRLGRQRYRWRAVARNGQIIAGSTEAYRDAVDAVRGIAILVLETGMHTPILMPADAAPAAREAVAAIYDELGRRAVAVNASPEGEGPEL